MDDTGFAGLSVEQCQRRPDLALCLFTLDVTILFLALARAWGVAVSGCPRGSWYLSLFFPLSG